MTTTPDTDTDRPLMDRPLSELSLPELRTLLLVYTYELFERLGKAETLGRMGFASEDEMLSFVFQECEDDLAV